ncbi:DNA polymerase III subunit alpha [Candidatus Dojkabacteria bacterium]|nr:DNA polymerase III subunit alpha [Candidatus Dojkabacteria bacterium]
MFTHLHLHTDYSLLDGVSQIKDVIDKVKSSGMKSCAITDHGNLYGAYKFIKAAKAQDIKPIIGCELYIAPRSMNQKEYGIDNKYFHLVVLAQNLIGYKNLIKLVSRGHTEGFYYKPRVDFKTLSKHAEGLIALTACLGGILSRPLSNGNKKLAMKHAEEYSELFKDRFFIEIQRNGIAEQKPVNKELLKIAREKNLPIVATCDSHFIDKDDYELQEILWAIRDGKVMTDPTRAKLESQEFYVKTSEEMEKLFEDLPEAIENTQKIADMVEKYSIEFGRVEPVFEDLPKGMNSAEYLRQLTYEGAEKIYGKLDNDTKDRIDYELKVIDDKGYNDYFLIVRDFAEYCHENGIVIGMRGSGCGSVVAYAIGITHVEPFKWQLYFERFLNYERANPPDFDIDVADDRRDELINYTIEKFGEDCVKQIGTFSKLQTKQAIRDVSRVLDIDLAIADSLSKMVEVVFGKSKPIDYMIENNKEFADIINSSPDLMRMSDIVRKITGVKRGVSTHACGILITPKPVVEYVPIQNDAHGGGIGMSQYEMFDVEPVGLMKFDFLGLKNLAVIGRCLDLVEKEKGERIDIHKLDFQDPKVFELLGRGHTVGIFQLESEGMRRVLSDINPDSIEEICYLLAAYRPGPMEFIPDYVGVKNGTQEPDYIVPELKPILEVTNGVITYQEQIMKILAVIADYSLGEASVVMKSMSKKIMEKVEKEKPRFFEGGKKNGFDEKSLDIIWERLLKFANYGFNKAHSSSYAHVTYWTAYLKSHYPEEFMAALLESDLDNFDRLVIDLAECKRLGIDVLPPDINKSSFRFVKEGDRQIRFGLAAIKNVGEDICADIVQMRDEKGPFRNLDDFIYRTIPLKTTKRTIEYFIQAGAMDKWGEREALLRIFPDLYDRYKKQRDVEKQGQIGLFSTDGKPKDIIETASPVPVIDNIRPFQKLQWEKELLGLYLSSHPLDQFEEIFAEKGVTPISQISEDHVNKFVIVGGNITNIRRITTRKGDNMAFITLEDKTGTLDIVSFPNNYELIRDELKEEVPVLIAGKVNDRDDQLSLIARKVKALDPEKHTNKFDGIIFRIRPQHTENQIKKLKDAIRANNGAKQVKIITYTQASVKSILLKHTIEINPEIENLIEIFR